MESSVKRHWPGGSDPFAESSFFGSREIEKFTTMLYKQKHTYLFRRIATEVTDETQNKNKNPLNRSRGIFMRIWITKHSSYFLDVQEANSHVSEECWIRNMYIGRWFENGGYTNFAQFETRVTNSPR